LEQYTGADAFIEVLNAHGVENIFFNPGGEQAAIQATIARNRVLGKRSPRLVLCLDESVALTAAHGNYVVTGQPQIVMVHSELGTLQLGGALHNAQWGRVPVVLWAGLAPAAQRTDWMNQPYDQGLIARNSVKWDHNIGPNEDIQETLQEALRAASTEPRGPVYLTYGRDSLTKKIDRKPIAPFMPAPPSESIDGETLDKVADTLIQAKNPMVLVGYTARYPETIPMLVDLAETLAAPVLTSQVYLNFPNNHPLSAGIEQILGSRKGNPYLAEADVILVIDYDMPYAAAAGAPGPNARIIHVDVDPLTVGRPLFMRGAGTFIKADSRLAIPQITKALKQRLTPPKRQELTKRFAELSAAHRRDREQWRAKAEAQRNQKPISPDWLCRCLAEVIDEDTIVVNHTISHSASVTEQLERSKPGTLIGCPAGSIQFGLGASLGAKIGAPSATVVSVMTDGGFVWGCPVATLWSARAYRAPFLAVICNNQSYGLIRQLVRNTAGKSESGFTDRMAFEAGVDFVPPIDYAGIAESCGAFGRTLEDPAEVPAVMRTAMDEVRRGRAAVIDARLERG